MFKAAMQTQLYFMLVNVVSQQLDPNLMFCFNTSLEKEKQITLSVVDWT